MTGDPPRTRPAARPVADEPRGDAVVPFAVESRKLQCRNASA